MTTINFDAATKAALDRYITSNFPDACMSTEVTTCVALALWAEGKTAIDLDRYKPELSALATTLGVVPGQDALAKAMPAGFRYYDTDAEHHRLIPEIKAFVGQLSMARVTLPASGGQDFETGIGSVLQGDHLYRSVDEFKSTFRKSPYSQTTRLDLITPARQSNVRFGAISVYLGYTNGGSAPSFYVLEAGTATGEPKVPFECPVIGGQIKEFSNYRPTAFSKKDNIYVGTLTLSGDSPDELNITSHRQGESPYMKLSVKFKETATPRNIWPGFLLVRAALIVELRKHSVPTT